MKKETKNNDNDDNIDYGRLEFSSNKKYQSKPTLEIVIKKEIKEYENNRPTPIATRNKFKTQIKNFKKNIKNKENERYIKDKFVYIFHYFSIKYLILMNFLRNFINKRTIINEKRNKK